MGLFSKKGEGDDDSMKSNLFSRSKNKSPNPSVNPYAQPAGPPSAADPYSQAKFDIHSKTANPPATGGLPSGPKAGNGFPNNGTYGSGFTYNGDSKSAGNASQYGRGAYGASQYGTQQGYGGEDRYGGSSEEPRGSRYGPGGYGGLGSVTDTAVADRNALFQSSTKPKDSLQDPPPYGANPGDDPGSSAAYGGSGGYNGTSEAYGNRQLTAEEEEEEDVQATKQEIKAIKVIMPSKRVSGSCSPNVIGTAIGCIIDKKCSPRRRERIHNTEKNLDLTANHNRSAEDKAKELKRLNGSMFAIHPSNPFTASKRREERDAAVMERHRLERDQREASRNEAYKSDHRLQETFKGLNVSEVERNKKSSLAERAKYQFDADSEDDEMENEIDDNIQALSGAATRLNGLAKATGQELDEQNRHLRRLNEKSTNVDDQIAMNRARLDRFK